MGEIPQLTFASGEIAPALRVRVDQQRYFSALAECLNWVVLPTGGVTKRPGTRFGGYLRDDEGRGHRLIPFIFSRTQAYVIDISEAGGQVWARNIDTDELGVILVEGVALNIATPFLDEELADIGYAQDKDTLYLAHTAHKPSKIQRTLLVDGSPTWAWEELPTWSEDRPKEITATAGDDSLQEYHRHIITAVTGAWESVTGEDEREFVIERVFDNGDNTHSVIFTAAASETLVKEVFSATASSNHKGYKDYALFTNCDSFPAINNQLFVASGVTRYGTPSLGYKWGIIIQGVDDTDEEGYVPEGGLTRGSGGKVHRANTRCLGKFGNDSNTEIVDITWRAVKGATSYNVYRWVGGNYHYVGSSHENVFADRLPSITPDASRTPPFPSNPFRSPGRYPARVTIHEQRAIWGRTEQDPQGLWMSAIARHVDFATSTPALADQGITARIASRVCQPIEGLLSLRALLVLTEAGEWAITSGEGGSGITSTSIKVSPEGYRGSSPLPPLVVGDRALYVPATRNAVRDLGYSLESDGYKGADLSIFSSHLFEGATVVDWCYQQSPWSVVWLVLDDGSLLSLTFIPEQQMIAWAQHHLGGWAYNIVCIPEDTEDAVYVSVKRGTRIALERLQTVPVNSLYTSWHVDSGLRYSGTPVSTITGLDHLEGEEVAILADRKVHPPQTVASGSVSLDYTASDVLVGLPISARLQTLPPDNAGSPRSLIGRQKTIPSVLVYFLNSVLPLCGPDTETLSRMIDDGTDPLEQERVPTLYTKGIRHTIDSTWGEEQAVVIESEDPTPCTILAIIPDVFAGGR